MSVVSAIFPDDPARISITAHLTGYSWYAKGMSHESLVTWRGKLLYHSFSPIMWIGRMLFGVADLNSGLQQRHLILDHLLEKAVTEKGFNQIIELACGLSPRGFRFMKKHGGKGITYIEADLPKMAALKEKILEKAGLLSQGHRVLPCDMLIDDGELSLRNLAATHLDPSKPVLVITEGIINYFSPETISGVWKRISNIFNDGAGGIYLTDNCPMQKDHKHFYLLDMFMKTMGVLSRGKMYFHFDSDEGAKRGFEKLGYTLTNVYSAEDFYGTLPVPRSRQPGFIRVIEACVDK